MKIFALIMAILVLALSIMPCADGGANESEATTIVKKANHQQSDPQQDDCSPFCQCSCCGTFSPNHSITTLSYIPSCLIISKSSFLPANIIEVALPIWQPPQLV